VGETLHSYYECDNFISQKILMMNLWFIPDTRCKESSEK